jgi:putative signal transducing protein
MSDELVTLTVVPNEAEGELIVNQLQMEEIPALRRPTNTAGALGGVGWGGQQEILVSPEDLDRAREIISSEPEGAG